MRWYNRFFKHLGNRRVMTRDEFIHEAKASLTHGELIVMTRERFDALLDVVAIADILERRRLPRDTTTILRARLPVALLRFRLIEDEEHPPSAIKPREAHMMNIPAESRTQKVEKKSLKKNRQVTARP